MNHLIVLALVLLALPISHVLVGLAIRVENRYFPEVDQ